MTRRAQGLIQGTVDVLILRALEAGALHGYGISRLVRERSNGALTIESAALYQALHRLERRKLVRSSWGTSETNRRAKFYALTAAGRKQLQRESAQLSAYMEALKLVLEPG